ncbi:abortive infection family protein [Beijerinckia sp. L45]|uniref:abortive infection family protein n=1 Tax=Beijerinckia sp. L45 TaxID=1641855 RepID=UPI002110BEA9|nr:abortive infection family protein [Beijerinckia sp. L45]
MSFGPDGTRTAVAEQAGHIGLYRAIRDPLGLSPDRSDLSPEIADDVRKVLAGLVTTIEGIGALRNHGGDAHERERQFRRIDAQIAKLIHAASTAACFILETLAA